ncbi:hypothetical protein CA54_39600 [Symmachiella macrocystis]|uniref:DUF4760 domain-containing protein n=1 Tax=Symmachiella macrocystis TaxID=2527985 RepID=A0A5C6B9G0_9PLAN|nr:hypothetical protein [Symmachiella macrocystis]TWU08723.1 hypothetical protein CA54_39600 [Symmachiella macrocystis]
MLDQFLKLNEPQLAFLAGTLGMILASVSLIACAVAIQYRKYRTRELELAFKDDLLNRGLSAADIDLLWSGQHRGYVTKCLQFLHHCWQYTVECVRGLATALRQNIAAMVRMVDDYRTGRRERALAFQREMLDRGLSVDEICALGAARRPWLVNWISDCCLWLATTTVEACRWIAHQVATLAQKLLASGNSSLNRYWHQR